MIIDPTIITVISIIPVILFVICITIMTIRFKALGSRVSLKMSKFRARGLQSEKVVTG